MLLQIHLVDMQCTEDKEVLNVALHQLFNALAETLLKVKGYKVSY